jgi:hypothetical protein
VAAHEVPLKRRDVVVRDARLGERAEAGVHAVDRRPCIAGRDDRVDGAARSFDARARLRAERDLAPVARDLDELSQPDRAAHEHGPSGWLSAPSWR